MGMTCREIMDGLDRVLEPIGWKTGWYNSGGNCMIISVTEIDNADSMEEDHPFIWITSADTVIPEDRYAGSGGESFSPCELDDDIQNALSDRGLGECWDEFHLGHYDHWEYMENSEGEHWDHSYIKGVENLASSLVAMIRAFYLPITSEKEALAWTDSLAFLDLQYHLDDEPSDIAAKAMAWDYREGKPVDQGFKKIFSPMKAVHISDRVDEWAAQGGWELFELYPEHGLTYNG